MFVLFCSKGGEGPYKMMALCHVVKRHSWTRVGGGQPGGELASKPGAGGNTTFLSFPEESEPYEQPADGNPKLDPFLSLL